MTKLVRGALLSLAALFLVSLIFGFGFVAGHLTGAGLPSVRQLLTPGGPASAQAGTPTALETTFAPFWESWQLVHREYVDQPVDDTVLMRGALEGMLAALGDEHTAYMPPAEYEIALSSQHGELEGIGASVEPAEDYVRIVRTLPGSPAERAGLQAGDLILAVDGQDVKGMDYFAVISLVRGPAGSTAHLDIMRGDQKLTFDVVRAKISVPSVEDRRLESGVAYVRINEFGEKTTEELKRALRDIRAQNPPGLILDLRGNPGGYLDTAIEVVSQFIAEGVVMQEVFGDGRTQVYEAEPGGLATQIPLVVLVDPGSASASEIVAGAIQDRGRGTLVGETTFGKGSVQNWHELQGDNGAIRVTIARWLTPGGRSISGQGIAPDVVVPFSAEEHAAGRDPQLDEAVRLLQSR